MSASALHVRWLGHATFLLDDGRRVMIDPFVVPDVPEPGIRFAYPALDGSEADVLLVTHEHQDHNAVDLVGGRPFVIRSKAGTMDSPIGTVVGIASDHDGVAGTQRGWNVIYRFELGGLQICHLGDLGQPALREEQRRAIGPLDLLFVPVGGRLVLDGETAASIVRDLRPRIAIPMHYGTYAVNYLDPVDGFLAAFLGARIEMLASSDFFLSPDLLESSSSQAPTILVPSPPGR